MPTAKGPGGWVVVGYTVAYLAGKAPTLSGATVSVGGPAPNAGQVLRLEAIAVSVPNPSGAVPTVQVYDADPADALLPAAQTGAGISDEGFFAPPITIPQGGRAWLVFEGVDEGTIARARVQFMILQGLPGLPTPVAA
jgi:hypothetical protein